MCARLQQCQDLDMVVGVVAKPFQPFASCWYSARRCNELALKLAHVKSGMTTMATSAPWARVNYATSDSEGKIANECQVGGYGW